MSTVVIQWRVHRVEVRPPQRVEITLLAQAVEPRDGTITVVREHHTEVVELRARRTVVREPAVRLIEIPRTVVGAAAHAPNLAGLASERPETAQPCTLYLATDTGELSVWR